MHDSLRPAPVREPDAVTGFSLGASIGFQFDAGTYNTGTFDETSCHGAIDNGLSYHMSYVEVWPPDTQSTGCPLAITSGHGLLNP